MRATLSPSLRAQRSNPESLRGKSLDCFAALPLTEQDAPLLLMSRTRCSVKRCCAEPGPRRHPEISNMGPGSAAHR
ncbi:hypothetical protein XH83_08940 [Bradyrhizobium sp. CCBAU 53351]|nr:hypothetical protein XH83_08940 [Bradyrhizobium sp. CCBAU 53351]